MFKRQDFLFLDKSKSMITHISHNISRANFAEVTLGNVVLLDHTLIIPAANLIVMEKGDDNINYPGDEVFNGHEGSYVNFCFVVYEGVETITSNFDTSRDIPLEKRDCYGGVHYLTGAYAEFWVKYNSGKIALTNQSEFRYIPNFFSRDEKIRLLAECPVSSQVLKELSIFK